MPTFETSGPVSVAITLAVGDVRITTSDRDDAVVEVQPGNESASSERMARQTQIEYSDGRLSVRTPTKFGMWPDRSGRVKVDISVPTGSRLDGGASVGELLVDGELGDCHYRTGYGAIRIGRATKLRLGTGVGDVTVDRAAGDVDISIGTGQLRVRRLEGAAVLKSSNGDTWVGEAIGRLRVNSANGDISVDRAPVGVVAKTAHGGVRVGEVGGGSVVLETAAGQVNVGIPEGTAAWLDLNTGCGSVRNGLSRVAGPDESDQTVEVRARTYIGDITVHRS